MTASTYSGGSRDADPAQRRYAPDPADAANPDGEPAEIPLAAGNLAGALVRVGATVRRPVQPQSLAVAHYLDHLQRVGFDASPRYLGRDRQDRDVLTYIDGDVATDPAQAWVADEKLLAGVARLVHRLHEASDGFAAEQGFAAPAGSVWHRNRVRLVLSVPDVVPELISHLDVNPRNVVVRDGLPVGLIDFDLAGPTTRLLDAYNTAVHWVPLCPPELVPSAWTGIDQAARLRIFAEAYGMSPADRIGLPDFGIARAEIAWQRMRAAAEQLGGGWARMWDGGAGETIRRRQAWLIASRAELLTALS
jgi:hypothetical protein